MDKPGWYILSQIISLCNHPFTTALWDEFLNSLKGGGVEELKEELVEILRGSTRYQRPGDYYRYNARKYQSSDIKR